MESKISVEPLDDRLLVERVEAVKKIGAIFVPDKAQELPQEAIVIAVGPGKRDTSGVWCPVPVSVGDHVLVGKYAGIVIEVEGKSLLLCRQDEILAKIVATS